jgi:hypothetical protein
VRSPADTLSGVRCPVLPCLAHQLCCRMSGSIHLQASNHLDNRVSATNGGLVTVCSQERASNNKSWAVCRTTGWPRKADPCNVVQWRKRTTVRPRWLRTPKPPLQHHPNELDRSSIPQVRAVGASQRVAVGEGQNPTSLVVKAYLNTRNVLSNNSSSSSHYTTRGALSPPQGGEKV